VRSRGSIWSPDGSRLALFLAVAGSGHEPAAIGILNRDTLVVSVLEVPILFEIVGWTADGNAVVILTQEAGETALKKTSIER
jgi:hypothetical protein